MIGRADLLYAVSAGLLTDVAEFSGYERMTPQESAPVEELPTQDHAEGRPVSTPRTRVPSAGSNSFESSSEMTRSPVFGDADRVVDEMSASERSKNAGPDKGDFNNSSSLRPGRQSHMPTRKSLHMAALTNAMRQDTDPQELRQLEDPSPITNQSAALTEDRGPIIPSKPVGSGRRPPPFSPLGSSSILLTDLRRTATRLAGSRVLDIKKILKRAQFGDVIDRVPTKRRRRWGRTLCVLFDQSPRLIPYRQDYKQICDALKLLIPWSGFSTAIWLSDNAMKFVPNGACVVALSDLGGLERAGARETRRWEKYGAELARSGCRTVAILPGAPLRDLKSSAPSWQIISWQRAGRLAEPTNRELFLDGLLTLASQADRVEPGLLRSFRRLLGSDADSGLESLFWQAPELLSNHPTAATIDPTERSVRRQRFAELNVELRTSALEHLLEWRHGLESVYANEIIGMDADTAALIPSVGRKIVADYFIELSKKAVSGIATPAEMAWGWRLCEGVDPQNLSRYLREPAVYDAVEGLRRATLIEVSSDNVENTGVLLEPPQILRSDEPAFNNASSGIGFVCQIRGIRSHQIVLDGLSLLQNLSRNNSSNTDPLGDGAGVLVHIPDLFFREEMAKQGVRLPPAEQYAVGYLFMPRDEPLRAHFKEIIDEVIKAEGQVLLGYRDVPVDREFLPNVSHMAATEPFHIQVFIGAGSAVKDNAEFERRLFMLRKVISNRIYDEGRGDDKGFNIVSLSTTTVVYKGMLLANQVGGYYRDLADPRFESGFAIAQLGFSTNTFPSWKRAYPTRMVAHSGASSTLRGNILWMAARQASVSSPLYGDDISKLWPISYDGQSDTACFDNALEFLVRGGYSLAHAVMILIPEAWAGNQLMKRERKAFYEYHAALMEPWDGPAAVAFTDGRQIGATLDRNGLRPARYFVTSDDRVIMASEAGVLPVPEEVIVKKWRLQPGEMLLIDMEKGRIIFDKEVKDGLAHAYPYQDWLDRCQLVLEDLDPVEPRALRRDVSLLDRQQAFGYTLEDTNLLMLRMATTGQEAVGSMGTDTPISAMSDKSKLLYTYFKQNFAQVTNPPIDPIREELVMSLVSFIGPRPNILDHEGASKAKRLEVRQPILTNGDLEKIRSIGHTEDRFDTKTLDFTYDVERGAEAMPEMLDRLCERAEAAVRSGYNIIVLSDRQFGPDRIAIPALLATAAVHNHLIRNGLRTSVGIVVESGEPRETHHFCCLVGYGAEAINPYLAFDTLVQMHADEEFSKEVSKDEVVYRYIKAVGKGILKVMAKMGISTYQSYCGAQTFDAVGLSSDFVDKFFFGTATMIEGVGLAEVAAETFSRHKAAFGRDPILASTLDIGGDYAYRMRGEAHSWTPGVVAELQHAVRGNAEDHYREFARLVNESALRMNVVRGLFNIKMAHEIGRTAIDISEVEPAADIVRRFATGAMSFGSISREAHTTLAIAMNKIGGKSNTGEGGEESERYLPKADGSLPLERSAIKQVASGRFGVTTEYLVNADMLQIKVAQGAKPGEGDELPLTKVDIGIAKARRVTPGVALISPPAHHDIYSVEDLAQLIFDLKNVNPVADISVKLVSEVGVGTVAAGVAKARADHITVSGYDGGTGASPLTSLKHAGSPWEIGLAETQQTLVLNGLRSRVALQVDGGLKTGRDVIIGALLGADEFGFSTAPLIAAGCIMMRKCHLNTCPVGVATQDPVLRKRFKGLPEHVINYFFFVANDVRELLAAMGFRSLSDIVGRSEYLEKDEAISHWKARGLDFTRLFHKIDAAHDAMHWTERQSHPITDILDRELIASAMPALETRQPMVIEATIKNVDRSAGAMLSGEVAKRYGQKGLRDDTITVRLKGTAGQSFGAFLARGITFDLEGDGNDYVGKGLSGGRIIIRPPENSQIVAENSIIVGNTVLYGATTGEVYFRGVAGERFAVRNSGAIAVVEGVGDHGCEYMTGGVVVVIGETGRNFAAGMSGGVAYVLDEEGDFARRCNMAMVELQPVPEEDELLEKLHRHGGDIAHKGMVDVSGDMTRHDEERLFQLISNHAHYTGSTRAKEILDNWTAFRPKFRKVMPVEYRRALEDMERLAMQNAIE